MRLTMFRFTNTARQAFDLSALAAALCSSNAAAQACSDYPNGVLDGDSGFVPPSQLQISRNSSIRILPAASLPSTNFGTRPVDTAKWDFGRCESTAS